MSKEAALREYERKLNDVEQMASNIGYRLYFHEDCGFVLNSAFNSDSHELGHEISDVFLFLNGFQEGYDLGEFNGSCAND